MSDLLSPMTFDSETLNEVPVTIGDKIYILREASGAAATAWRNDKGDTIRLRGGKPVGAKDMANPDPKFLSRCLFNSNDGTRVALDTIQGWPDRIQKGLIDRLFDISDLSVSDDTAAGLKAQRDSLDERIEEMEESAKNDSED